MVNKEKKSFDGFLTKTDQKILLEIYKNPRARFYGGEYSCTTKDLVEKYGIPKSMIGESLKRLLCFCFTMDSNVEDMANEYDPKIHTQFKSRADFIKNIIKFVPDLNYRQTRLVWLEKDGIEFAKRLKALNDNVLAGNYKTTS